MCYVWMAEKHNNLSVFLIELPHSETDIWHYKGIFLLACRVE